MYKALVRSHLDYCDIIYHEPCKLKQPPLGVTLTAPMENIENIQYQAALLLLVLGKARIAQNYMKN